MTTIRDIAHRVIGGEILPGDAEALARYVLAMENLVEHFNTNHAATVKYSEQYAQDQQIKGEPSDD